MSADALELLEKAYRLAPEDARAARGLVEAQMVEGSFARADVLLAEAIERHPGHEDLLVLRSEVALKLGSLRRAASLIDEALVARPASAALLSQRARVHLHGGEWRDAAASWRRSLGIRPDDLSAQSALIVAAYYDPEMDTERLKRLQRTWGATRRAGLQRKSLERPAAKRRLRVGYVSCGFYGHAAARAFSAVLLNHDPAEVEIYCYAANRRRDWLSVELRQAAAQWRSIAGLGDTEAAETIRRDGIDILVDVDGHYPRSRLGIFILRPAPLQVSGWGHLPGPGIPEIDWLMTDGQIVPEAETRHFPERIIRLACAQPYRADLWARPERTADGPIRFGCFNRFEKLGDECLALWGKMLAACPGSTLTLRDIFYGESEPVARIWSAFARSGVGPHRIRFDARILPRAQHLAAYDDIDVALDPFPVNGGITTFDALASGVPILTLRGRQPTARIGASILTYLGLQEFICDTEDLYCATAIGLHADEGFLRHARAEVAKASRHLGVAAEARYARSAEDAFRHAWAERAARNPA